MAQRDAETALRVSSTIIKQMRLTYGYPFADEERYVRLYMLSGVKHGPS